MSRRLGLVVLALLSLASPALAERPRSVIVPQDIKPEDLGYGAAPYNTIFLNPCTSGCTITPGTSNSLTDRWPINSTRTLTAFPYGDEVWQQVMECVKDVFEPYNVQITDVDPGSANHFEIMIAGHPNDLGMSSGIGGVAPGGGTSCSSYLNNALVFDFAKVWGSGATCGTGCVEDICSTAAQEIGHTWNRLDHVIDNKDPMTYFSFAGRKYYQNSPAQCGSDCVNGVSPFNQTCTGTNKQEHDCICGGATQNSHNVVMSLFGAGPGNPPVVTISSPKQGDNVQPGFPVVADAVDNYMVSNVEVRIDGELVGTLTKGPFVFNAPATLADGTHRVEVTAYDPHNSVGKAMVDVYIGAPCEKPSDCSKDTDTCVGGRCVPGAGVQGGLGQPCTGNTDCASGQCATDGSAMYCVEQCAVGDCPDGFGCTVDEGATMGVCWPGFDDGSGGGCGCESSRGGPLSMMLLFGWVVLVSRRRGRR